MTVKIWLLMQVDQENIAWDDYRGFVVQAKSEERAREMIASGKRPERPEDWLDPKRVSAEWLGIAKGVDPLEIVVLGDCNQG